MLALLVGIVVSGLLVGSLARLAVPGPDPMPVWLTIGIGVAGSFAGGIVGAFLGLTPDQDDTGSLLTYFLVSLAGATVLLVLYRRFVQGRPVTGPEGKRMPVRGLGLRRLAAGRRQPDLGDPVEQLAQLVALRDAGKIDREEFERRKAALVARI